MNRIVRGILLGALISLLIAVPILAAYYAYITVEETDGNSYTNLPVTVSRNVTQLVEYDIITSTGLDTRVLTGEAAELPHMLANDRIMFVTDLAADEERTLIFYAGASSLSDFPIIVGYNGSISTPDDADLEPLYVTEILVSGYFDSSSGSDKNILYKEDAFRMNISAANTLRVAALNATGGEQWEMHYSSFASGEHTIYVLANGLVAYLYVDDFEVAKDTANLFDTTSHQCINKSIITYARCFYDEGYYWVFYKYNDSNIGYITSTDGLSWSGETTIAVVGGDTITDMDIKMRGDYIHVAYVDSSGADYVRYRRGDLTSAPGITWSAAWQTVTSGATNPVDVFIAIDSGQYPYVFWEESDNFGYCSKSSANDGTWSTAGGYPFEVFHYGANNGIPMGFMHYPNSDKLLIIWVYRSAGGSYYNTLARYYNGSAWEPQDDISSYVGNALGVSMAADNDDNMYITWNLYGFGTDQELAVRYDGEVWGTLTLNDHGDGYWPLLSYNENTGILYILYGYENGGDYVYCATLNTDEMELNTPVSIMSLLGTTIYGVSPYEDHIGFLLYNSPNTYHGLINLTAYQWNDNSNNWTWMQNNVMSYSDYMIIAVDGTSHLQYQPATIIQGTTLPDISGASGNDGIISWGSNPSGVSADMGVFSGGDDQPSTATNMTSSPGWMDPQDMMGPTGNPGWTAGLPTLASNPLYPLMNTIATETGVPLGLVWILFAAFWVVLAMLLCYRYMPHLMFMGMAGGAVAAFFVHMTIFPFWVIYIFVVMIIAGIVGERMPTAG